jgi:hypothetical protein
MEKHIISHTLAELFGGDSVCAGTQLDGPAVVERSELWPRYVGADIRGIRFMA